MNILVKFRKIIFILSFSGLFVSGCFFKKQLINHNVFWARELYQQAETISGVVLGLAY
jgi:putative membrane protein